MVMTMGDPGKEDLDRRVPVEAPWGWPHHPDNCCCCRYVGARLDRIDQELRKIMTAQDDINAAIATDTALLTDLATRATRSPRPTPAPTRRTLLLRSRHLTRRTTRTNSRRPQATRRYPKQIKHC